MTGKTIDWLIDWLIKATENSAKNFKVSKNAPKNHNIGVEKFVLLERNSTTKRKTKLDLFENCAKNLTKKNEQRNEVWLLAKGLVRKFSI